jgi:hypothetical protein
MGSTAEVDVGAIVEGVERGNHAAMPDPDEASVVEVSWKLTGQLETQIVHGQGKSRSIQRDFRKFFEIVSTGISSPFKNSFGKTILAPKTASAGEGPVSSLGCAWGQRSTQGISSAKWSQR